MYKKRTTIMNSTGLHARPASDFVACAMNYKSKILIKRVDSDLMVEAKSMILLLTLGLNAGTEVEISGYGEDETEAVDAIVALIESKFGEE